MDRDQVRQQVDDTLAAKARAHYMEQMYDQMGAVLVNVQLLFQDEAAALAPEQEADEDVAVPGPRGARPPVLVALNATIDELLAASRKGSLQAFRLLDQLLSGGGPLPTDWAAGEPDLTRDTEDVPVTGTSPEWRRPLPQQDRESIARALEQDK